MGSGNDLMSPPAADCGQFSPMFSPIPVHFGSSYGALWFSTQAAVRPT